MAKKEMKYLIQLFYPTPGGGVGVWHNTALGGDDKEEVLKRAEEISKRPHAAFSQVRVTEVLLELEGNYHEPTAKIREICQTPEFKKQFPPLVWHDHEKK